MKTYFFSMVVKPAAGNRHAGRIESALAHFWVVDESVDNAVARAKHFLSEYYWTLSEWDTNPVETTAGQYPDREVGLKRFLKAQQTGFASLFLGVSSKGRNDPLLGEEIDF
jgi:hypothetical protein